MSGRPAINYNEILSGLLDRYEYAIARLDHMERVNDEISLRNKHLEEKIGRLEKNNELLKTIGERQ